MLRLRFKYTDIYERLKRRLKLPTSKLEGSLATVNLEAVARELEEYAFSAADMLDQAFLDTASGDYLTRLALENNIERRGATNAEGEVTFYGASGVNIPYETVVASANSEFTTLEEGTIDANGEVTIPVIAVNPGALGNAVIGAINVLPYAVPGVTSVRNNVPVTNGYNIEGDMDLRERVFARIRNPVASGNAYHYEMWATEVPGVGKARVFPTWNGAGTVKVSLLDANQRRADAALIEAVRKHIEDEKPIGATVTVVAPTEKVINVSMRAIVPSEDHKIGLEDAVRDMIVDYFSFAAFNDAVKEISIAQLGYSFLNGDTMKDYASVTLNGSQNNVFIGADEIPVLGSLTITSEVG